jgi:hypothetical protein
MSLQEELMPASESRLTADRTAASLVAAAVWAPSVHNTQPWWFGADGRELSLYADADRQLAVADPSGREMLISCGAALFTARLALRALGWIPQAVVFPDRADPLLVARISWRQRAAPARYELRLFDQVLRRRTHRGGFDPLPLAPDLLAVLEMGAARDQAELRLISSAVGRAFLAATVQDAVQQARQGTGYLDLAAGQQQDGRSGSNGLPGASDAYHPGLPEPGLRARSRLGASSVQR